MLQDCILLWILHETFIDFPEAAEGLPFIKQRSRSMHNTLFTVMAGTKAQCLWIASATLKVMI